MLQYEKIANRSEAEKKERVKYHANRIRNEYVFYDVVCSLRDESEAAEKLSVAFQLHSHFLDKLTDRKSGINTADKNMFMNVLNTVIRDYFGIKDYLTSDRFDYSVGQLDEIKAKKLVPLSPFDERFCLSEWALKGDGSLVYACAAKTDEKLKPFCDADYSLTEEPELTEIPLLTAGGTDMKMKVLSKADLYGMAVLSLYLPKDNPTSQRVLSDWVTEGRDPMSLNAVGRMCSLLDRLAKLGVEYTVDTDKEKGQLRAKCADRVYFRIVEKGRYDYGIGRAYCDRIVYEPAPANGQTHIKGERIFYPTSAEVTRIADYLFGEEGMFVKKEKSGESRNKGYYVPDKDDGKQQMLRIPLNKDTVLNVSGKRQSRSRCFPHYFADIRNAREFIKKSVDSARENYIRAIEIEKLTAYAEEHGKEDPPVFSADLQLAKLQESCWNVIWEAKEKENYSREAAEKALRDQGERLAEVYIGRFEEGKRFNPVLTARYTSSDSVLSKTRAKLGSAMIKAGVDASCLTGDQKSLDDLTGQMIEFNEQRSEKLSDRDSEFWKGIYDTVCGAVRSSGCELKEDDVLLDDRGVIRYRAARKTDQSAAPSDKEYFYGYVGQIFAPEESERFDGVKIVRTKFNKSKNYLFVPGYEARIFPQETERRKDLGKERVFEERIRLIGYEDRIKRSVTRQIRKNIIHSGDDYLSCTALNGLYGTQYGERYPYDAIDQFRYRDQNGVLRNEEGLAWDDFAARLKTLSRRVHFDSRFRDEAGVMADLYWNEQKDRDTGFLNDLSRANPFVLTGFKNISVIEDNGYFSPTATSNGSAQGCVRYLCDGAEIKKDGTIKPTNDDRETALIKRIPYAEYDTVDRVQMVFSNLLSCRSIAEDTGVVFTNLGQFNQNDGVVISKRFADSHKIYAKADDDDDEEPENKLRPLTVGDKLCDMHGNKFTISLVVDRNMDAKTAKMKGIYKEVKFFRENAEVDAVASPYSFISRFNAGSAREIMYHQPRNVTIDGRVIEGALGFAKMIVTHHAIDKKLNLYDRNGRKFNPQLTAAMISAKAEDAVREVKEKDEYSFVRMRELLQLLGIVLDDHGDLSRGFATEGRDIVSQPSDDALRDGELKDKAPSTVADQLTEAFMKEISWRGGYMEIPFDIVLPAYKITEKEKSEGKKEIGLQKNDSGMYLLPLLPPFLREGVDDGDDGVIGHYYTGWYETVFRNSILYRLTDDEEKKKEYQMAARNAVAAVDNDLIRRIFHQKKGFFKEMMGCRLNDSATAVWVANPRLNLDEVCMSKRIADQLKVNTGDHVLLWRDPILSDGGVRYLKVVIDKTYQYAVGVHPAITKSFKGDFDGDSVGLWKPKTPAGKKACGRLTVQENLLDKSYRNENRGYDFAIDTELDMQAVLYQNAGLREKLTECLKDANSNSEVFDELNEICKKVQGEAYGINTIRFGDVKAFAESVCECADNKAKGSYEKANVLFRQLGITVPEKKDGNGNTIPDFDRVEDRGETLATDEKRLEVMYATAVKSQCTGNAGKILQRGLLNLLDGEDAQSGIRYTKAVMELTSSVTQSLLQVKHDPERAKKLALYLSSRGPLKRIWNGKSIKKTDDLWGFNKHDRGNETKGRWIDLFEEFYTDKDGLDVRVNKDYIRITADAMSNKEGMLQSIEKPSEHSTILSQMAFDPSFGSLKKNLEQAQAESRTLNLYGVGKTKEESNIACVYAPKRCLPWRRDESDAPSPIVKKWLAHLRPTQDEKLFYSIVPKLSPSPEETGSPSDAL